MAYLTRLVCLVSVVSSVAHAFSMADTAGTKRRDADNNTGILKKDGGNLMLETGTVEGNKTEVHLEAFRGERRAPIFPQVAFGIDADSLVVATMLDDKYSRVNSISVQVLQQRLMAMFTLTCEGWKWETERWAAMRATVSFGYWRLFADEKGN